MKTLGLRIFWLICLTGSISCGPKYPYEFDNNYELDPTDRQSVIGNFFMMLTCLFTLGLLGSCPSQPTTTTVLVTTVTAAPTTTTQQTTTTLSPSKELIL